MKKILSFVLVVAMMLPMIIMPASATETPAADWKWEDEFEELDARNIGQPKFNVGADETTGVVVDGQINENDNYTVTQELNFGYVNGKGVTDPTDATPNVTVKMARKGDRLYLALVVTEKYSISQKASIRLGLGTSRGYTLGHTADRINVDLYSDGRATGFSRTFTGYTAYNNSKEVPVYMLAYVTDYKKGWKANDPEAEVTNDTLGTGVYEVEADITALATALTPSGQDKISTVRMMQFMFFYNYTGTNNFSSYYYEGDTDALWKIDANPYFASGKYTTFASFKSALNAKYSEENNITYTYAPSNFGYPIAFGGADVVLNQQDPLGEVGKDVRNLGEGHVIDIQSVAAVAPVLDGIISNGEYTVVDKLLTHAKAKSPKYENGKAVGDEKYDNPESQIKANFAYKDGYLYVGVTTDDTAIRQTQLDMNVLPYATFADTLVNRNKNTITAAGVNTGCDAAPSIENGANAWATVQASKLNYGSGKFKFVVDYAAKLNDEGYAVYEYKISLATFAEFWKNIYPISEGFTYFGFQFWSAGNDGHFGGDDDQYGYRTDKSIATLKAIDSTAWGLEWVVYTISIPETVDSYKADHMFRHFYNNVDFDTAATASARVTSSITSSGLRFKSTFDADFLTALKAVAGDQTITYGTLIAPKDYIAQTGLRFTMDALEAKYGDKGYVKVIADINNPFEVDANGNVTIAGSITNIKEANLDRDFCAIAFVQYGDTIIYGSSIATRNVSAIADAAVKDTKAEAQEGYMNMIEEGKYSPYDATQYGLLQSMIKAAKQ